MDLPNIQSMTATARKIVGHFRHSPLATKKLHDIQVRLGLPIHKLIQDVPTRWGSKEEMMNRLIEQKSGILEYESENTLEASLTASQWRLMGKVVRVLKVFKDATLLISSANSLLSEVLPTAKSLRKEIQASCIGDDAGVVTLKQNLLDSIDNRFADYAENEKLLLSTAVDPR